MKPEFISRPRQQTLRSKLALLRLEHKSVMREIARVKRQLAEIARKEKKVFENMAGKEFQGTFPIPGEPAAQQHAWDHIEMADLDDESVYKVRFPEDDEEEEEPVEVTRTVVRLDVVFQRKAQPDDPEGYIDSRRRFIKKTGFRTQTKWMGWTDSREVNIPLGYDEAGLEYLKMLALRIAYHDRPFEGSELETFYVVAKVKQTEEMEDGRIRKTTFHRTIVPRTEIDF